MYAAVKVRGDVDASETISTTIESLGLLKKNQVLFVEQENEAITGMLEKAKDYIAYGEVSDDVVEEIEDAKGVEIESGVKLSMTPPSGGFKSTKKNYNDGGALGKRPNMDELLRNMF